LAGSLLVADEEFSQALDHSGRLLGAILSTFDAASGRPGWKLSGPSIAGHVVGMYGGHLLTLNPGDLEGTLDYRAPDTGAVVDRYTSCDLGWGGAGNHYQYGNRLFLRRGMTLTALDLDAKRRDWQVSTGKVNGLDWGTSLEPTVQDGHLYVGGTDLYVYSIEPSTGRVLWRFKSIGVGGGVGGAPMRYGNLILVQYDQVFGYRIPA
jgi:outer membrane protein assembly factor BamB